MCTHIAKMMYGMCISILCPTYVAPVLSFLYEIICVSVRVLNLCYSRYQIQAI